MKRTEKYLKNFMSFVLAITLAVGIIPFASVTISAASTKTQAEALAWVNSRIGQMGKDTYNDGDIQCVDLIREYYMFLGFSPSNGNGCDYDTNTLPAGSGFRRIADYYGFVPEPGDIAVWNTAWGGVAGGHVAIVISANLNNLTVAEVCGSSPNDKTVKKSTLTYNGTYSGFYGVIRPAFATSNPTTGISLNATYDSIDIGETTTLTATVIPSNATNKTVILI